MNRLPSELLLRAYAAGIFPMAESAQNEELYWFEPEKRGILPLDHFRIPKSVRAALRDQRFSITFDSNFDKIINACAAPRPERPESWINDAIKEACIDLHKQGYAHSVEAWQNDVLVGGLYGVALGGAFFGESMFSHVSEASKVCLVALVERLRTQGFVLLDTQYQNDHLVQFGVVEISRAEYRRRLAQALLLECRWS